ncbi:MAG: hypothetical protein ABI678_20690 [Kofleriaceae bacterium]
MQSLDAAQLAEVRGGADVGQPPDPSNPSFGRCGPGMGMKFLGNVYTPECTAHDQAVHDAQASGSPYWLANLQALPKLPAAAWSYVRARVTGH